MGPNRRSNNVEPAAAGVVDGAAIMSFLRELRGEINGQNAKINALSLKLAAVSEKRNVSGEEEEDEEMEGQEEEEARVPAAQKKSKRRTISATLYPDDESERLSTKEKRKSKIPKLTHNASAGPRVQETDDVSTIAQGALMLMKKDREVYKELYEDFARFMYPSESELSDLAYWLVMSYVEKFDEGRFRDVDIDAATYPVRKEIQYRFNKRRSEIAHNCAEAASKTWLKDVEGDERKNKVKELTVGPDEAQPDLAFIYEDLDIVNSPFSNKDFQNICVKFTGVTDGNPWTDWKHVPLAVRAYVAVVIREKWTNGGLGNSSQAYTRMRSSIKSWMGTARTAAEDDGTLAECDVIGEDEE